MEQLDSKWVVKVQPQTLKKLETRMNSKIPKSTRFWISKLNNSMSDSNAIALPKNAEKHYLCKMKHAPFITYIRCNMHHFSSLFGQSWWFSTAHLHVEWSTFKNHQKIEREKMGTRNSTRHWKIVTRVNSIENFHNWFWTRLDPKICRLDSIW